MKSKKLLASVLCLSMVATGFPALPADTDQVIAATSQTPGEITLPKNSASEINPIGGYVDGDILYGGDPAVYVDGDTVYLYEGHDCSTTEGYYMPEWVCYSTKDLKNWTYHGVIMTADKKSITWANTGTDAWAGQITKYNNKYYFYYCTWDRTASGKQSIGVATSDSPTGPFVDIGAPLVKGTFTTDSSQDKLSHSGGHSDWNDIDPTVWVETDSSGVEHRYLNWGNGRNFTCELNEDMISVKDVNNDGQITFGTKASGATSSTADVIEMVVPTNFTEAPWLYRRTNASGKYYGDYYLFYAYGWREEMAYATMPSNKSILDNGTWTYKGILMGPTATSNTNHMAVFDFQGKTYFIYHNGSLPGGSGFRRSACIAEMKFNDDGTIEAIPETTVGLWGTTSTIYTVNGKVLTHESFENSSSDAAYPYLNKKITEGTDASSADAKWVLCEGKADKTKDSYVSIQSENKPGLYLTVNDDRSVTLAQDASLKDLAETAKKQTFKTVEGLAGKGVSFESVSKPGTYLTYKNGVLCVTGGAYKYDSTFGIDADPQITKDEGNLSSTNDLKSVTASGITFTANSDRTEFSASVEYTTNSALIALQMTDANGYFISNGVIGGNGDTVYMDIDGKSVSTTIDIYAADGTKIKTVTIRINRKNPPLKNIDLSKNVIYNLSFDSINSVDVTAALKGLPPTYKDNVDFVLDSNGVNKSAIKLDGSYGLDLGPAEDLGESYSISFWLKPTSLNGANDAVFAAGTFKPEYWLNSSFGRPFWSKNSEFGYIDDAGSISYQEGIWQHVVITVDGSSSGKAVAKYYLNGKLTNSGTVCPDIMTQVGSELYLGMNGWDAYFNGSFDEVVLLDRVINENEILGLAYNMVNASTLKYTAPVTPTKPVVVPTPTVAAPSIKAPVNTSKGISLSWKKVSGATGYYVYRNNKKIKTITKNSTVSFTDAAVKSKNGSKYIYKIVAYKTANGKTGTKSSASKTIYRMTAPTSLSAKALSTKTVSVTYKRNKYASGYQIQYATKSSFKGAKTKAVTKSTTLKKSLTGLKKYTKYYVRIRSYKKVGKSTYYSSWSSGKAVRTKKK